MIPVLYDNSEKAFVTNGIGRLSDCISCTVTEERNGIYECEFEYPITGIRYSDIQENCIITATHDDTGDIQPFEIYRKSAPINGIVTFYAHHISYRLSDVVIAPCTAESPAEALNAIKKNSINSNPFNFWTDKTGTAAWKNAVPSYARAVLFGEEGSILDVYGKGEYEFDRWAVKLHLNRGTDSGVEIRYGKNLTDIEHERDVSSSYNAVVPFWQSSEGTVIMLPEKILIYSGTMIRKANLTDELFQIIRDENEEPLEVRYKIVDARPLDLSSDFENPPTTAQLRAAAAARLTSGQGWLPNENIKVDFIQLWQTEEYANYAPLQRVRLCDTVSVYYPELGVEAVKQKVIRTVFNVLLDRYDEIELGDPQTSLSQSITGNIESLIEELPTTSMMTDAIAQATQLISGGLGGHVQLKQNANGKPEEILIMDNEDINAAVKLWRWNLNGLGYSKTGYSGSYGTAITMDGSIVADYITTGTLNANLIKAGVLADINGNTSFNLSTGSLTMTKGSINIGSGKFIVDTAGNVSAESVSLKGSIFSDGSTDFVGMNNYRFLIGTVDDGARTTTAYIWSRGNHTEFHSKSTQMDIDTTNILSLAVVNNDSKTTVYSQLRLTKTAIALSVGGTSMLSVDSDGVHLAYGTNANPVYIPAQVNAGGTIGRYYTMKVVSGILMNA